MKITKTFSAIADKVAEGAGHPTTFVLCCLTIVVWAIAGPFCGFSDTWQLVINTGTTIVTFLMVFLIQNTQNRENAAMEAKLDALVRASEAHNRYIGIECLSQEEVAEIRQKLLGEGKSARQAEGGDR